MMTLNETALDFTSPGSMIPDATDLIKQITTETETTIHTLEQALETGTITESGWQLLASLYLGINRINDFNTLKDQYEDYFNASIFTELCHNDLPQFTSSIVFEIPQKITHGSLPEITTVIEACHSPRGALLDFSKVRGADIKGLKTLTQFFTQLSNDNTKPKTLGIDRFIANLKKTAGSDSGTEAMWNTLFEYYRFCDDMDAFDDIAIRYAVHFSISPPSW
tara:strand:+ start:7415 stop:8080 length:666 start_codon:yes stop_codon:yes gene_type:complete